MKVCAVFESNGEGGYGVYFPGLPGCISAGDSLTEARRMALEAVTGHVALMMADGEHIPPAVAERPGRAPKGAVVEVLEVSDAEIRAEVPKMRRSLEKARLKRRGKCVRLNITLPEELVGRADRYAEEHGESRSGMIAHALEVVMEKGD
jgi:predicted RNase H-like HicB family nuclease